MTPLDPVLVVFGYLLGGVPTGLLLVRAVKGIDIRQYGSGNIGTANVVRVAGPWAGAAVFVADFLKGLLPVLLARQLTGLPLAAALAGFAAVCGHCWPVWLGFRGGRGVATGVGALAAVAPLFALAGILTWVLVVAATRYASAGSMAGLLVAVGLFTGSTLAGNYPPPYLLMVLGGAAVVIWRHRENIGRLLRGEERRLGPPGTGP